MLELFIISAIFTAFAGGDALANENGCDKAKPILEQPTKWLMGTLKQRHERVLLTYKSYTCGAEHNAKARAMRDTIIQSMIDDHEGQAEAEEVVKYLVHYVNINHRAETMNADPRDNYRSGQATLNFVPRNSENKVFAFIEAQAPKLSREGLAKVIAFDSIPGTHGIAGGSNYRFTKPVLDRLKAESDPRIAADILRAMNDFPPLGAHTAFKYVKEKIVGMTPQAIIDLFHSNPQIFRNADVGNNSEPVNEVRKKLFAELAKHTAGNAEAQHLVFLGIENYLPKTADATAKKLDDDVVAMIHGFGAHAPIAQFPKFIRDVERRAHPHPMAVGLLYQSLSERKSEDLASLLPAKVDLEFKDYVISTIHSRTGKEGQAGLGNALAAYYRALDDDKAASGDVVKAVADFAKNATGEALGELLAAMKNGPAQSVVRAQSKEFDAAKRKEVYAAVASFEERPVSDEYNSQLALWKQDALDFARFGKNAGSDEERRNLVFKILSSLETAKSGVMLETRGLALDALTDLMRRKPLASDANYRKVLERLVGQDPIDFASVSAHDYAIKAYVQAMRGEKGNDEKSVDYARAVIAKALAASLADDKAGDRSLRLYSGLRSFSGHTGEEHFVIEEGQKKAREILQSYNRNPDKNGHALAAADALIESGASEFDAEIGLAFFNMLRYMGPQQQKHVLQYNMRVIGEACLKEGVTEKFNHLRHLCGFPGATIARRMNIDAVTALAPLVSSSKDEELAKQARQLIAQIEERAEKMEKELIGASQPPQSVVRLPAGGQSLLGPSVLGVIPSISLGNLQTILCLKTTDGKPEIQSLPVAKLLSDIDKEKLCKDVQGQLVNPQQILEAVQAAKPAAATPAAPPAPVQEQQVPSEVDLGMPGG